MNLKAILQTARNQGASWYERHNPFRYVLYRQNGRCEAVALEGSKQGIWLLGSWYEVDSIPESAQEL